MQWNAIITSTTPLPLYSTCTPTPNRNQLTHCIYALWNYNLLIWIYMGIWIDGWSVECMNVHCIALHTHIPHIPLAYQTTIHPSNQPTDQTNERPKPNIQFEPIYSTKQPTNWLPKWVSTTTLYSYLLLL